MDKADEPVTVATVTFTADQACHLGWVRAHAGASHRGLRLLGPLATPETRDRVRAAIVNSGYQWPDHTGLTVSVDTPYPTPDPGMDLAAAVAVLAATGQIPDCPDLAGITFCGQMGLDGTIQPPRQLADRLAFAAMAQLRCVVAPPAAGLTDLDQRVRVWEVANLRLLVDRLAGHTRLLGEPHLDPTLSLDPAILPARYRSAVRALEVAAAGGHHLAIATPALWEPLMLGQLLAGLLPDLDPATTTQVARLYPRAGLLPRRVPHRPPWQPITYQVTVPELVGTPQRGPGLASLTHGGVILVGEQPACARGIADALCQLLDQQHATITAGDGRAVTYPARVQLVLGLGGCNQEPGAYTCQPDVGSHVASRRPNLRRLLDRVDIHLPLPRTAPEASAGPVSDPSAVVAARVAAARAAARHRWAGCDWDTNSRAEPTALARLMPRPGAATARLDHAHQVGAISSRALIGIRRLAVTIADLAGRTAVTSADVAEAYRLRTGRDLS